MGPLLKQQCVLQGTHYLSLPGLISLTSQVQPAATKLQDIHLWCIHTFEYCALVCVGGCRCGMQCRSQRTRRFRWQCRTACRTCLPPTRLCCSRQPQPSAPTSCEPGECLSAGEHHTPSPTAQMTPTWHLRQPPGQCCTMSVTVLCCPHRRMPAAATVV